MSPAKRSESSSPEASRAEEAFLKVRKELDAVSDAELVHINVDMMSVIATAYGALPAIRSLRAQPGTTDIAGLDLKRIDRLETYTQALFHAHTAYVTTTLPAQAVSELVQEATQLRARLYADALALAGRDLVASEPLHGVKTSTGHKALALDLSALGALLRASWDQIEHKTAAEAAELDHAAALAEQLLIAVGRREIAPAVIAASAIHRQRAFALFLRAYDEARRMVTFVRWREGDVDEITPSLYAGRQRTKRRKPQEGERPRAPTEPGDGEDADARDVAMPPASASAQAPVRDGYPDDAPPDATDARVA